MESVDFWIQNNAEIDPFICTPYVGSPIFYDNQDFLFEQYDYKLKLVSDGKIASDQETIKKWRLNALDQFMTDCGDATQYTATVSQNFTILELFAIKNFMLKHDVRRLLQMAHQRYEQTGLPQWKHSNKWEKYCQICSSKNDLNSKLEVPLNL